MVGSQVLTHNDFIDLTASPVKEHWVSFIYGLRISIIIGLFGFIVLNCENVHQLYVPKCRQFILCSYRLKE